MDLLAKARELEASIARRLDRAAKSIVRSPASDPLDVVYAVVDAVEAQIQPGGRGGRVFPFTHVAVSIAATADARARFDAVLESAPKLHERIAERIAAAGCVGAPPAVSVEYVSRAHKHWRHAGFGIQFSRIAEAAAPVPRPDGRPARIELTVARGVADRRTYSFGAGRIDIGRGREVRDRQQRLIRVNDLAFPEGGDAANQTVSRQHAHIAYDASAGAFRVYEDGSVHGTTIVRAGRTVAVPRGARGVRLQSGDEIVLGEARIRVRVPEADRQGWTE